MLSVTWNEDGTGWEKCKNGGCRVYMFNAGIKYAIYDTLSWIVQDPESFAKDVDPNVRAIFTVVSRIRPRVDRQKVMQVLFAKCRKFLRSLKGDSDAEFLAQLNRNWKEGCAICLTDKIMGTTCGCGHTEIIVFRPCGHSCCKEPCFFEFNKAAPRKKKILKSANQTFIVRGQLAEPTQGGFDCHMCRQPVESVFRAEEVSFSGLVPDSFVQECISEIQP